MICQFMIASSALYRNLNQETGAAFYNAIQTQSQFFTFTSDKQSVFIRIAKCYFPFLTDKFHFLISCMYLVGNLLPIIQRNETNHFHIVILSLCANRTQIQSRGRHEWHFIQITRKTCTACISAIIILKQIIYCHIGLSH